MNTSATRSRGCPFCGHSKIMEVFCHHIIKEYDYHLPECATKGRVPIFERVVDSDGCVIPDFHSEHYDGDIKWRFEKQTFFDGKRLSLRSRDLSLQYPEIIEFFWKCKKCLRTWSPISGNGFSECPVCKMNSGVRIMYGMPSYLARRSMERGEMSGGGCCMCFTPYWSCNECGYEWGSLLDDLLVEYAKKD